MKLEEARELRRELEAIEATMERIKALWASQDFPSVDQLYDLGKALSPILGTMESIVEKAELLSSADELSA